MQRDTASWYPFTPQQHHDVIVVPIFSSLRRLQRSARLAATAARHVRARRRAISASASADGVTGTGVLRHKDGGRSGADAAVRSSLGQLSVTVDGSVRGPADRPRSSG